MGAAENLRVRREDCYQTKHDSVFSKWEILIGPSDWEDYSLGKDGAERYRIHNLPISSCPGLYELGIAKYHTEAGRKNRKINPHSVIVVYLGQADNVRTRLQHYGRSGSHLDHGVSFASSNKGAPTDIPAIPYAQQGPGLFMNVFSRGLPIVFRWAPMKSKKEAELKESQLLAFFDYAWNKGSNGSRRADDILQKLDKTGLGSHAFLRISQSFEPLKWEALGSKNIGIEINSGKPIADTETNIEKNLDLHARILKVSHSRPRLVAERTGGLDPQNVCGVALGNGSVCKEPPVPERKRCSEHKGMRINGLHKGSNTGDNELPKGSPCVCGMSLEDGSFCMQKPVPGRMRCEKHKERPGGLDPQNVCGVALGNGSVCKEPPVPGRKRCSEHKGRRINGLHKGSNTGDNELPKGSPCVCGVSLEDGSFCMQKPVPGRKRCENHKGRRVTVHK